MKLIKYLSLFLFLFTITSIGAGKDEDPPRLSPEASVYEKVGYTDVTIVYCRPGVKDRKIWGDIVPYNEVWRTGANEATTIEFSKDVKIEGKDVPAGKYSLFTIPGEKEWTVIINKQAEQWGAFNYNQDEDLVRFKVKPEKGSFAERLLFTFDYVSPYTAKVVCQWENVKVSFTIEAPNE